MLKKASVRAYFWTDHGSEEIKTDLRGLDARVDHARGAGFFRKRGCHDSSAGIPLASTKFNLVPLYMYPNTFSSNTKFNTYLSSTAVPPVLEEVHRSLSEDDKGI